jgi:hypothetical protein
MRSKIGMNLDGHVEIFGVEREKRRGKSFLGL